MLPLISKELKQLYYSRYGWLMLAIACFILSWSFLLQIESYQQLLNTGNTQEGVNQLIIPAIFNNAALIGMLLSAALSSRLLSMEQQNGTLAILFASPVSHLAITISKMSLILAILLPVLMLTIAMALSLTLGTTIDYGIVLSNAIGVLLLFVLYASFAVFCSSITSQPALASAIFLVSSLLLWLFKGDTGSITGWISMQNHLQAFSSGLLDSRDIAYFIICSLFFVHLSVYRLERLREQ